MSIASFPQQSYYDVLYQREIVVATLLKECGLVLAKLQLQLASIDDMAAVNGAGEQKLVVVTILSHEYRKKLKSSLSQTTRHTPYKSSHCLYAVAV